MLVPPAAPAEPPLLPAEPPLPPPEPPLPPVAQLPQSCAQLEHVSPRSQVPLPHLLCTASVCSLGFSTTLLPSAGPLFPSAEQAAISSAAPTMMVEATE